jgi:hypothetical protein
MLLPYIRVKNSYNNNLIMYVYKSSVLVKIWRQVGDVITIYTHPFLCAGVTF